MLLKHLPVAPSLPFLLTSEHKLPPNPTTSAGIVDCTESENRCCGGSNGCGTVSGVCEWIIGESFCNKARDYKGVIKELKLWLPYPASNMLCAPHAHLPADLVACEDGPVGAGPCSAENPCTQPTGACVESVQCVEGQCVTNYRPSDYVCGTAAGDCEIAAK